MRRFLLIFCFLLWFAHVALALPSYCTLTGTVLAPDGTPCAACKITITTAGNQEVGGSSFPGGKSRSWMTDASGDLPAGVEVARTLVVKIQIDKGATVTVSIPDVSTTDISSLLLEPIDVPSSTDLNSLSGVLAVTKGGTGAAPDGDDQVLVSTGTTGADWETIGDCDGVTKALNYDTTTNTFTCNSTIQASDLSCSGCVAAADLASDSVTEAKLKAVDAASDEECLTYETTTGDFEWQSCGGGGGTGDVEDVGDCSGPACFNGTTGNSLQFEGATANGFETTLTATDPTADRTITMPNRSGTVALEKVVNLYDYAACDGTDESTAIQSAITAACALGPGGTLYVPADICYFASTLTLCSGLAITGSDSTERVAYGTAQPHELRYTGTGTGIDAGGFVGVRLSGLLLRASSASFTSGILLDVEGASYVYLDRVFLTAPNQSDTATSKLVYANNVVGLWITGSSFARGGYHIYGKALSSDDSNVVSIKDTAFYQAEVCSVMNPGDTWDVSSSWWQQQGASDTKSDMWCHDAGVCARGLAFHGNMTVDQPNGPTTPLFDVCGDGLSFSGNFIAGNTTQDGIQFSEPCDGCSIQGNWFGFLDKAVQTTGTGSDSSGLTVLGNSYTSVTASESGTRPLRSIMHENASGLFLNEPVNIWLNVDTNADSGSGSVVIGSNATSSSATQQYAFLEDGYANFRRGNDLRFYDTAANGDDFYVELSVGSANLASSKTITIPDAAGTMCVSASGALALSSAGALTTTADPVSIGGAAVTDASGVDLVQGTGITITSNTGVSPDTATFAATLGTDIVTGEIVDGTIAYADVNNTGTLAGNPANGASSVWIGTTGLLWEGSTSDTIETLLVAADPTASDKTITLPNASGTVAVSATSPATLSAAGDIGITQSAITVTNLASACTDAQVLGGNAGGTGVECQTDDDVPEAADYSNLTGGTGITNSPTGTINATLGTDIVTGEIVDGTIAYADANATATLAGDPAYGNSSVWFATTGLIFEGATSNTSEGLLIAADVSADRTWTLPNETGTICTGTSVCSTVYQAALTGGDVTTVSGGAAATIGADKILESMLKAVDTPADEECLTYEATGGDFEWQSCGSGSGISGIAADTGGTTTGSTVTITGTGTDTTRSTDTISVNVDIAEVSLTKGSLWQGNSSSLATAYSNPAGIDVRTYGAACDGSTDDSTAIGDCITDRNTAGGGTCLIPATGSACVIKNDVTMKSNANIVCQPGARIAAGTGGTLTNAILNASSAVANVRIEGCIFNNDQVKIDMVRFGGKGTGLVVDHNKFFWNFDGDATSFNTTAFDYLEIGCTANNVGDPDTQGCLVESNQILGSDDDGQNDRGININGDFNLFSSNFIVAHNEIVSVGGDGINATALSYVQLLGNTVSGVHDNGLGGSLGYAAIEANNVMVNASDGGVAGDITCGNCRVVGNVFPTNSGKGVFKITAGSGTQFSNNYAADGVQYLVTATGNLTNHPAIKNNVFNIGTCADDPIDGASLVSCVHVQNPFDGQIVSNSFVGTAPAGGASPIRIINRYTTTQDIYQVRVLNNIISMTGAAGTDSCIDFDDQSGGTNNGFVNVQVVANSCGYEGTTAPDNCVKIGNIAETANWADVFYSANIFDDCTTWQSGASTTNVTPQVFNSAGTSFKWEPRGMNDGFQFRSMHIMGDGACAAATNYMGPISSGGNNCNATEATVDWSVGPNQVTFTNMTCRQNEDTTCTAVFTLRDDAADTSATCTTTNNDTCAWSGSVTMAASSLAAIKIVDSGATCTDESNVDCDLTFTVD